MSSQTIRLATRQDIRLILALSDAGMVDGRQAEADNWQDPAYLQAFETIEKDPHHEQFVMDRDKLVIGTMQLSYIPGIVRHGMWRGLIENVHIREDLRGQGLGGDMIRFAIERCRDKGCGMVQLTSNKKRLDAHRFYERLGFEKSHEGFKQFL